MGGLKDREAGMKTKEAESGGMMNTIITSKLIKSKDDQWD